MTRPQLWLLVGGNGAGKTTFHRNSSWMADLPFVNADRIARRLSPDAPDLAVYRAARDADALRRRYIEEGVSFCAETVFSHPSKIDLIHDAKRRGFEVSLVYIHLAIDLHAVRVIQRVDEGGHDVPSGKIMPRVLRLREHVKEALPHCDFAALYDNSDSARPFELILTVESGRVVAHRQPVPAWAVDMTSDIGAAPS